MRARQLTHRHRSRGVSLVEALVAMAVMSIGMLALVGVQATLRLNSDLAKQRTEATRIASEEIERLRDFTAVQPPPGQAPGGTFGDIAGRTLASYATPENIGNTTYSLERTVTPLAGTQLKTITVTVSWEDRRGVEQTVRLDSGINGVAPALTAMLTVPHRESASSQRQGRHASIPLDVLDLPETGESLFRPPGTTTVGFFFNTLTGVMQMCQVAADLTRSDCVAATLVSGTVRYSLGADAITVENAEQPEGTALNLRLGPDALELVDGVGSPTAYCYANALTLTEQTNGKPVDYFCAVTTASAEGWGGQLNPVPVNSFGVVVEFGPGESKLKSCRYTPDTPTAEDETTVGITELDAHAEYTANINHPRKYCLERPRNPSESGLACTGNLVKSNLINQNFLVIRGNLNCPNEPEDGLGDPLVNGNTRQHQPAPGA